MSTFIYVNGMPSLMVMYAEILQWTRAGPVSYVNRDNVGLTSVQQFDMN